MAVSLTVNNVVYSYPSINDIGWGAQATAWATAVSQATLQKSGGSFTLTAEIDFGTTYGVKTAYVKSRATNPASAGVVRLGNAEKVSWRNAADSADLDLSTSVAARLTFGGVNIPTVSSTDTFTNKTLTSPAITTPTGLVKGDVGLGNVDNTSDANKPVSTAQAAATTAAILAERSAAVQLTFKDIDGGTASNTNRITLPKNTDTNLAALTRKQGTILYDTVNNVIKYDDGSNLQTVGTASTATSSSQGLVTSFTPTIKSSVKSVASANYTILDTDGFAEVSVTTGSSDRTVTLPAVGNNTGRVLRIKKADSGAGGLDVTPASGTLDGKSSIRLYYIYEYITLFCDGTNWLITSRTLNSSSQAYTGGATGSGRGTTNTTVRVWANSLTIGGDISYTSSATLGDSFTINSGGTYTISCSDRNNSAAVDMAITKNQVGMTTGLALLRKTTGASATWVSVAWTGRLESGDVIRMCSDASGALSTAAEASMNISRVG